MKIIRTIILGIILIGGVSFISLMIISSALISCGNKGQPEADIAPYMVQTSSRIYLAAAVEETPERVKLSDYYIKVDKKWEHRPGEIYLNRRAFGEITISKRDG